MGSLSILSMPHSRRQPEHYIRGTSLTRPRPSVARPFAALRGTALRALSPPLELDKTRSSVLHRLNSMGPPSSVLIRLNSIRRPRRSDRSEPTAWRELVASTARGASTEQLTPGASNAPSTSSKPYTQSAPNPSSTPSSPITQSAPNPSSTSSAASKTQLPNTPIALCAAQPPCAGAADDPGASPMPSTAPSANRWAFLDTADSLRLGADRAARSSTPTQFAPGQLALTPQVLLVGTNAANAFDTLRPRPPHEKPSPYQSLAPSGKALTPPATSSSSVLGGDGGSPGAASPLQLSLVLLTAWRALWCQRTSHPASIVLPNLAPPG